MGVNYEQHLLREPNKYIVDLLGESAEHFLNKQYADLREDVLGELFLIVAFGLGVDEATFKRYAKQIRQLSNGSIKHEQALNALAMALGYKSYGSMRFMNKEGFFSNVRAN